MNQPESLPLDPLLRVLTIMTILRSPQGCPWDREQTHRSLKTKLIEECYELLEAIDQEDQFSMKEELADILLHVLFHAQIAQEEGNFSFWDVLDYLSAKLIRRHPHVFGSQSASTTDEVYKNWEKIKKEEKPDRESLFDGIPIYLPALIKAMKLQSKASKINLDWKDSQGPLSKIQEELSEIQEACKEKNEVKIKKEIGDLLFSVVNFSRLLGIDPEEALAESSLIFEKRCRFIEQELKNDSYPEASKDLDKLWQKAKEKYP
ncbi:nucleoside triphosphate pyrophosphohydrolase [Methylacidiphilum caldifontis]|uniref:Nucleoside triphosphate pyrophosphohydrolase n=1 Tax=Methylacidiphilum caldifontis TaxID=2795386 RepID=A0A4Y8P7S1_9BACT|nr:nucleoside triphosphate pyrophosphohydrolase [Methylacidiphilum caldifontis]TFE66536.1 nucleoside triphosphate pyrophosphohydrolase [Methylacidiphilum caldifontis]